MQGKKEWVRCIENQYYLWRGNIVDMSPMIGKGRPELVHPSRGLSRCWNEAFFWMVTDGDVWAGLTHAVNL
jgi:hypothetical protein